MPSAIRPRLVLAISAVSMAVVSVTFVALHEATGADLRDRIDRELTDQYSEFGQDVLSSGRVTNSEELQRASEQFVANQGYHPDSRIFAIALGDRPPVTNQQRIVEKELEDGEREGSEGGEAEAGEESGAGLVDAPEGISTVSIEQTGNLRVLSEPIVIHGARLGTFRVADPLSSVEQAQSGLRNTFLAVGIGALVLSVAIATWLASLITRPLRRMAAVASGVDHGDLSQRIEGAEAGEVGVLADAFNGMLERLESAFRRQREFVADASHELRSPLTVLRGRIELLARKNADSPRIREEAEQLLPEVQRMDRLIDDMLTLAQAERGTLIQRRRVPVADLAGDLRRDLPLLGPRSYRVDCEAEGFLDVDPDRLAQVLRNLAANSVRHTATDGRIDVTISADNGRTIFTVRDDGSGIAADQLEHIFDRFYRTDEGRGRDDGGSGLGLAIAKAIVEAHGGKISAESKLGQGTRIRVEIPGFEPARDGGAG